MSIAVLTQVYDEMRRLAIAGSVVAPGDFRLKKHLAPLEQAGAKAPVFAKVAEAVKNVVESNEKTSADAVLELTTLVNAILYTQGETGLAGDLRSIETTDLGAPSTQASARMLKPLLEALSTTGSGRMEQIREAYDRGMFRDFRLVKPALGAIDDVYGEIADFVSAKILPQYGKAILPELRTKLDLKGRAGHPRRLKLMHALDPDGTRPLVKEALDGGSKEVKVVAIECLGSHPEDLNFLLEQAAAKAQEVRQAAYWALATIGDEAAIAALQKAATGKDLNARVDFAPQAAKPSSFSTSSPRWTRGVAGLAKIKDKKDVSTQVGRLLTLTRCLFRHKDPDTEDCLLRLFGQRDEIAKIKGATTSGNDLNGQIVMMLASGSPKMQKTLIDSHEQLSPDGLSECVRAARRGLSAEQVYSIFSPYLTAKVDEKKKQRDPGLGETRGDLQARSTWPILIPHWQFVDAICRESPLRGRAFSAARSSLARPRGGDEAIRAGEDRHPSRSRRCTRVSPKCVRRESEEVEGSVRLPRRRGLHVSGGPSRCRRGRLRHSREASQEAHVHGLLARRSHPSASQERDSPAGSSGAEDAGARRQSVDRLHSAAP